MEVNRYASTIAQDFANHLLADGRLTGKIRHHRKFCSQLHL